MGNVSPSGPAASSTAPAWEPISLGSSCAVKFQTSRVMYFDKYGARGDLHECRRTLLTPDRGSANYERHVFDWPHREQMVRCIDEPDTPPERPGLLKRLASAFAR